MLRIILFIVLAVLCIAGAWWVSLLPGMVSATIAGTTFETSTPIAIVLAGLAFLLLYLWVRLLAFVFGTPARTRRWRARRNRERGDAAVNRALVALAANDAGGARREADRSRRLLGDTPLTLLLTAQAGHQSGREEEAEEAYRRLSEQKDGKLIGLRGLMRLAMQKQDWEGAAAIAAQAEAAHPGASWVREERRYVALRTGQWREALRLSGQESRPETRAALAVAAAEQEQEPAAALRLAKQAFEAAPGLTQAGLAYAARLRAAGRDRPAQEVLRRAWAANPHPDLADAYVQSAANPLVRAQEMASLMRARPEHLESHLALARAALEAGLTTDARRQLALARATGANERRVWSLAADIATVEGHAEEAQEALRHVADAEPDPVWRCGNCGTVHAGWRPVCPACQAEGTIAWTKPTEPLPPARIIDARGLEGLTDLPPLPSPARLPGVPEPTGST
ncbi:MAG: heme biosynthesis HemY N-terminal domain-containing protein [Acetobacteraceae bacterium]